MLEFKNVQRDPEYPELFEGEYGLYSFIAHVNDEPVESGIARGRIDSLCIICGTRELVRYEDEWLFGENIISLYHPIVQELEKKPTAKDWVIAQIIRGSLE